MEDTGFILYEVADGDYERKRQVDTAQTQEEASAKCLRLNKASMYMHQQVGYYFEPKVKASLTKEEQHK